MNRTAIFVVTIIAPLLSARSEPAKIQLAKVDLIAAAPGRNVFRIEAGEATVGSNVIKRVEFGKTTAIITYFNKTAERFSSNHRFRLFDAYGIQIASFYVRSDQSPGETQAHNQEFQISQANELLEFSTVALPADWATPIYLVIEDGPAPALFPRAVHPR